MSATNILLQALSGMFSDLTPVAIELDDFCRKGGASLASNPAALKEIRDAIAAAGCTLDTDKIRPILSTNATAEVVEWFLANPTRTHAIREAIEGEDALAGRGPATEYLVLIRQVRSGLRLLVGIRRDLIKTRISVDQATREVQVDNDFALSLIFDYAIDRPGEILLLDKLLAFVSESNSATAPESDSRRRLS